MAQTAQTPTLQSLIAGRWVGADPGQMLASAIDGRAVAHTHAEALDFGEALAYARGTGIKALMAMDFQERAARLKALAKYLGERKEALYAISHHTGATRTDGWIESYAMDYDLWLKIGKLAEPVQIDEPLAAFREHEGSLSSSSRTRLAAMAEDFRVRLAYSSHNPIERLAHYARYYVRRQRVIHAKGNA